MTSLFHEEMLQTTTYIQLQDAQPIFGLHRTTANSSSSVDKIKNDIFLHVMVFGVAGTLFDEEDRDTLVPGKP